MTSTGEPDGPPTRNGPSFADLTAGLYGTIGILAALHQRERDPAGAGQWVDVAMLDSLFSLVFDEALDVQVARGDSPRTGNRRPRLTPFGAYEAADGFIAICAVTDAQVAALFRAMGQPRTGGRPALRYPGSARRARGGGRCAGGGVDPPARQGRPLAGAGGGAHPRRAGRGHPRTAGRPATSRARR